MSGSASNDSSESLQAAVQAALEQETPLLPQGAGSKAFYGRACEARPLSTLEHRGIVDYDPADLVVTVRAGTPLDDLEQALAAQGQYLGFEPPRFGGGTIGGAIGSGLSGPRRPYAGSARDFVLGVRVVDGRGRIVQYGGRVVKNVAGYDLFRPMAGSLGTLGLMLDISLRVLPLPEHELALSFQMPRQRAHSTMTDWGRQPHPLSGMAYDGVQLRVRLSGTEAGVNAARRAMGGDEDTDGLGYWQRLRDHQVPFLERDGALWRLSLPPAREIRQLSGDWFIDWGGAQRWLRTRLGPESIRRAASRAGGHAERFRGAGKGEPFHPLDPARLQLHQRLKAALDPGRIFAPGRMYAEL